MTLQAFLYSYLTANAGVSAIVGTRVYESLVPQGAAYPAISYSLVSRSGEADSLDGADEQAVYRMQVNCWATSGVNRQALASAVRSALNGYVGTYSGKVIQEIWLDNELDQDEPMPGNDAQRLYGRFMDFMISTAE